jgi:predicted secreted protein
MRCPHIIAWACIVACVPARIAVAQGASPTPAAASTARPLLVDRVATDPAEIVRARVGQTFAIALRANASTGFTWELAEPVTPSVEPFGSAYESRPPGSSGGDQAFWLFRALSAGDARLTLRYVRPTENGSSLMERAVTFQVEIAP